MASPKKTSPTVDETKVDPTELKEKRGFFYIIQNSEVPPGVYKIGKTIQFNPNKRLCDYPKGSHCKFVIAVQDADGFEDYVMRKFQINYNRRREYGLEYYQGDIKKMIHDVIKYWDYLGDAGEIQLEKEFLRQIKPVGIQYFINEWYSKQADPKPMISDAYDAYVKLIKEDFGSQEYATKEVFHAYMLTIINS